MSGFLNSICHRRATSLRFEHLCSKHSRAEPAQAKHPYATAKPLSEPSIFAEGVVSTGDFDSHPAFTPDGKTLYFVRSTPNFSVGQFWYLAL
jgi:hypothetical protein